MASFLGAHLTLLGASEPGDAATLPAPLSAAMRAAGERQPLLGHMARPADDLEAARFARQSSSRFTERQAVSGTRRLLGRGDIVGQSSGAWHVRHKWGKSSAWICCTWMDKAGTIWDRARRELYRTDPFHSFVSAHRRRRLAPFSPARSAAAAFVLACAAGPG